MTSKEALENVVFATPEEYDAIKKDLEVLEIIKNHKLLNYVLKNQKCADMYKLNDDELNTLKEYIENDNITKK